MLKFIINRILPISLLLLFIMSFFTRDMSSYGFVAPDETINYATTVTQKETGQLFITTKLNSIANTQIFHPRGTLLLGEKILPRKFIGYPLIIGSLAKVIGFPISPYINLIILILLFIVSTQLLKSLKIKTNWLPSIVLVTLAPILYWTHNYYFESLLGLLMFATGLLFLLKIIDNKQRYLYIFLSIFFFSLGIYIRYDYLLFYLPLTLLTVIIARFSFKEISLSLLTGLLCVLPLFMINQSLYGHPLSSGQSSQIENRNPIVKGGSNSSALMQNSKIVLYAAEYYWLLLIPTLMVFSKKFKLIRLDKKQFLLLSFFIMGLILFSNFWLAGVLRSPENYIRESYNRYFLPLYYVLFLFILQTVFRKYHSNKFYFSLFLLSLLSILSVSNHIARYDRIRLRQITQAEVILNNTEKDAIIYIGKLDKIIYPHREVGYLGSLELSENEDKLSQIVEKVLITNREQYIYDCDLISNIPILNSLNNHSIDYNEIANCLYHLEVSEEPNENNENNIEAGSFNNQIIAANRP